MDFEDEPVPARNGPKKRFRKNKLKLVFDREERQKFLLGFRKRKQERKEKYIEKLERDLAKEKKRIKQQTQKQAKKLSSSHSVLPEVQSLIDNMPEKEETYDLGNTLVSITSLDDQIYRNLPPIKEEDEDEDEESEPEEKIRHGKNGLSKWSKKSGLNLLVDGSKSDMEDEEEDMKKIKNDPFFNPINDDELSCSNSGSDEDEKEVHYDPLAMLRKNTGSSDLTPEEKGLTKAKLEKQANRLLQNSDVFKKVLKIKQKRSKKFRLHRLKSSEETEAESPGNTSKGKKSKGKILGKFNRGKKRK